MIDRRKLLGAGLASAAIIRFPGVTNLAYAVEAGVPTITFDVDDVERGTDVLPLQPTRHAVEGLANVKPGTLESWSQDVPQLIAANPDVHPLLSALNTAYDRHLPIVLSPDMIWLQVMQGLAAHVNANAEALRHHFVAHEGKILIEIRRDGFRKGNPLNDWEGAFAEFSTLMRPHIGAKTHSLIASPFETTGPVELAAFNVSLMDAMQSFFVYAATTSCGFPSITLEGSVGDWTALRDRAAQLQTYDLDWWIPHLLPMLDQFIATASGNPDRDFWCNVYKRTAPGSGSRMIHGHILNLFPYFGSQRPTRERLIADFEVFIRNTQMSGPRTEAEIQQEILTFSGNLKEGEGRMTDSLRRNPFIGKSDLGVHDGMTTESVTTKMNSAPMVWNYYGHMYQMELMAGFIGATQDPVTLAVRPKIGWAVREGVR